MTVVQVFMKCCKEGGKCDPMRDVICTMTGKFHLQWAPKNIRPSFCIQLFKIMDNYIAGTLIIFILGQKHAETFGHVLQMCHRGPRGFTCSTNKSIAITFRIASRKSFKGHLVTFLDEKQSPDNSAADLGQILCDFLKRWFLCPLSL